MIQIIDVCKVLCSACGNYLEGVAAVCGNQCVRLCWQDFQIRAMKREGGPRCMWDPANEGESIGCICPYLCRGSSNRHCMKETDTHSATRRSSGGSYIHSESCADGRHDCGPRRRTGTTTQGVSRGETPMLDRWMDNVRHVCASWSSLGPGQGNEGLRLAMILLDPEHPQYEDAFPIVQRLPRTVREDFERLRSMRSSRRMLEVEAVINRLRELASLDLEPLVRPEHGFIFGEGI